MRILLRRLPAPLKTIFIDANENVISKLKS